MTKTKISDAEALERFENFDPQAAPVRDRTAVADIEQAVHARKVAEEATEDAVRRARHNGITWTEIASALGVSHQAAIKRYRDKVATADKNQTSKMPPPIPLDRLPALRKAAALSKGRAAHKTPAAASKGTGAHKTPVTVNKGTGTSKSPTPTTGKFVSTKKSKYPPQ